MIYTVYNVQLGCLINMLYIVYNVQLGCPNKHGSYLSIVFMFPAGLLYKPNFVLSQIEHFYQKL